MPPVIAYARTKVTSLFGLTSPTQTLPDKLAQATKPHVDSPKVKKQQQINSRRSPTIGGIRRIMKRAHTPEGMVVHYESRLRAFLGISDTNNNGVSEIGGFDDSEWQMIEQEEGIFTPFDKDMLFDEDDIVVLGQALARVQQQQADDSGRGRNGRANPAITAGIRSSLVTEWAIQDSYTRLIVHTMCRYYGLVSFSNTLDNGKNVLHICHPRFFKDAGEADIPSVTFHNFLFNSNNH
ncbi:hypothetical protein GGF37_000738 [Kickxella alabastrina]|nr:hypothetical protein GGF37_000738 [Kickxella alabastrina]